MAILSREDLLVRFGLKPFPTTEVEVAKVTLKKKKDDKKTVVLFNPSPKLLDQYEEVVSIEHVTETVTHEVPRIETNMTPEEIEALLQPASLDLVLGEQAIDGRVNNVAGAGGTIFVQHAAEVWLDDQESIRQLFGMQYTGDVVRLRPGQRALCRSKHWFKLPADLVAEVRTRSTTKRLGVDVVGSAGFIDPGFSGYITLEPINENQVPVVLTPGVAIAQLVFHTLTSPAEVYTGHYTRNEIPEIKEGTPAEYEALFATMRPKALR